MCVTAHKSLNMLGSCPNMSGLNPCEDFKTITKQCRHIFLYAWFEQDKNNQTNTQHTSTHMTIKAK